MHKEAYVLLFVDFVVSICIIQRYCFTNIDWEAYMEQVRMIFDGNELDYCQIRGNTGPLVYPAGFVYLYQLIRALTNNGGSIRAAQYIFAGIQCASNYAVFSIYNDVMPHLERINGVFQLTPRKKQLFRCAVYASLVISRRIHSLYVLRMFNDGLSMGFFYWAVLSFVRGQWLAGWILHAIALSVKMNILLTVPGITLVTIAAVGIFQTSFYVACAAALQIVLGAPFLLASPKSYISRGFDLSRRFLHRWSVNFQFVPKDFFENGRLNAVLLGCTLLSWAFAAFHLTKKHKETLRQCEKNGYLVKLRGEVVASTIFLFNLIGVIFSRTLHYQFYLWFYHQVPFILLTTNTRRSPILRAILFLSIEYAFSVYPPSVFSSLLLALAFCVLYSDILRKITHGPLGHERPSD